MPNHLLTLLGQALLRQGFFMLEKIGRIVMHPSPDGKLHVTINRSSLTTKSIL